MLKVKDVVADRPHKRPKTRSSEFPSCVSTTCTQESEQHCNGGAQSTDVRGEDTLMSPDLVDVSGDHSN